MAPSLRPTGLAFVLSFDNAVTRAIYMTEPLTKVEGFAISPVNDPAPVRYPAPPPDHLPDAAFNQDALLVRPHSRLWKEASQNIGSMSNGTAAYCPTNFLLATYTTISEPNSTKNMIVLDPFLGRWRYCLPAHRFCRLSGSELSYATETTGPNGLPTYEVSPNLGFKLGLYISGTIRWIDIEEARFQHLFTIAAATVQTEAFAAGKPIELGNLVKRATRGLDDTEYWSFLSRYVEPPGPFWRASSTLFSDTLHYNLLALNTASAIYLNLCKLRARVTIEGLVIRVEDQPFSIKPLCGSYEFRPRPAVFNPALDGMISVLYSRERQRLIVPIGRLFYVTATDLKASPFMVVKDVESREFLMVGETEEESNTEGEGDAAGHGGTAGDSEVAEAGYGGRLGCSKVEGLETHTSFKDDGVDEGAKDTGDDGEENDEEADLDDLVDLSFYGSQMDSIIQESKGCIESDGENSAEGRGLTEEKDADSNGPVELDMEEVVVRFSEDSDFKICWQEWTVVYDQSVKPTDMASGYVETAKPTRYALGGQTFACAILHGCFTSDAVRIGALTDTEFQLRSITDEKYKAFLKAGQTCSKARTRSSSDNADCSGQTITADTNHESVRSISM